MMARIDALVMRFVAITPYVYAVLLGMLLQQLIGGGQVMTHDKAPKDETPSGQGKGLQGKQQKQQAYFTAPPLLTGAFPTRHNTVTAEVLSRLIGGENLTGLDAVYCASTTRLAAVVNYLNEVYGWTIDRVDIDVGCNDGRVAVVCAYYLNRATIRRAFDTGALEFCQSVKVARAKRRKHATKAKAEADKRNAARTAAKFDPNQGSLFGGAAHA